MRLVFHRVVYEREKERYEGDCQHSEKLSGSVVASGAEKARYKAESCSGIKKLQE